MYELYDFRNKSFEEIAELRNSIKEIHRNLEDKGLANIPECKNCKGKGEYFTYLDQEVITCSWCKGEGKDYLISTTDDLHI